MKKKNRILVLIEYEAISSIIINALQRKDYQIIKHIPGEPMDKLLYETGFDLLITDIDNTDISAIELIKNIRNLSIHSFTPVILLCGREKEELKDKHKELHIACYLQKPFDIVEFYSILEKLV